MDKELIGNKYVSSFRNVLIRRTLKLPHIIFVDCFIGGKRQVMTLQFDDMHSGLGVTKCQ